jgi:hypothetical protein
MGQVRHYGDLNAIEDGLQRWFFEVEVEGGENRHGPATTGAKHFDIIL